MSANNQQDGPIVLEFGAQLAGFAGCRLRIYTLEGEVVVGRLVNAPMIYNALRLGNLTYKGVAIIQRDDGSEQVLLPVEQIRTFDVLPKKRV